jgi:hypothetical protein
MRRAGDDPAGTRPLQGAGGADAALGQVHAIRADSRRQACVGAGQQQQPAAARDPRQAPAARLGVRRAERAVDDAGAARQPAHDRLRIGDARRVGEEEQPRQPLPPDARRP